MPFFLTSLSMAFILLMLPRDSTMIPLYTAGRNHDRPGALSQGHGEEPAELAYSRDLL